MKPFDLELAKAGHPVCTRDGRKARIICFDKNGDIFPIIALISNKSGQEEIRTYTIEGHYCSEGESDADLFMALVKKEGWINIYSIGDDKNACYGLYNTKEEALKHLVKTGYITTIKIEWKE